jgi:cytochrome c
MKLKHVAPLALALLTLATLPAMAADTGDQLFRRYCFICHSTEPGQMKLGPSLAGVVGRESGTLPGYSYSPAMKAAHLTWDEATLDKYLTDPRGVVPGTKMLFVGVKNPDDRKALIAYLKSLKS